jgi:hypothetical protein
VRAVRHLGNAGCFADHYQALFAQQHRGQESAGIAVTDGVDLEGHTGMGLVSQVFNPRMLREELAGHAAIGHVRYSTTGSSKLCNAQPLLRQYSAGPRRGGPQRKSDQRRPASPAIRRARPYFPEHDRHGNHRASAGQADARREARSAAARAEAFAGRVQPAVSVPRSDRSLPRSVGRSPAGARQNRRRGIGASPAKPAPSTPSAPRSSARSSRARSSASTSTA